MIETWCLVIETTVLVLSGIREIKSIKFHGEKLVKFRGENIFPMKLNQFIFIISIPPGQFFSYRHHTGIYSWPVSLVAVASVVAQCTNRCTRRKGAVNAQPTNTEKPKMKKTRHHEEVVKCQNESTRVARLQSEPQGRERRRVGQNWLRMKTKAILTCESSKNLNLVCDAGGYF